MITTFEGETPTRHGYKAIEVWRRHGIAEREHRPVASEVANAGLWKWAIHTAEDRPVGVIRLNTDTKILNLGFRFYGPGLTLFIRPAFRGHDFALEVIKGLMHWVKTHRLFKIIHACHYADDKVIAESLIAAEFLYTGCKTYEPSAPDGTLRLVLHMIRIL
ncbi:hypothetical protein [Asticcacaulis benevestitus]|uniref:N-acetyltransferase domain-containing protein n=1 Tax=Asticcacaulis benevestitus DSM 16100 = ATCC BAA-896 TaxID=1121022 RepID=V4PQP5_9CAUL|nr:hypothetical protein [Asticcacaulis benevestitus]ESQ87845.1 hypothetical protein ABENE_16525 [Asticcacaulis benevestitus DSM 16100 = ATCC BAA-896]